MLTYLHALDRHDSGAARRQLAPGYAKQVEQEADSPFQNWLHLSDIRITQPAGSALGAENDPNLVELQAGFRLEQRDEVSMSNGGHLWWFTLRREPGAGRWLIVDEGDAPQRRSWRSRVAKVNFPRSDLRCSEKFVWWSGVRSRKGK